MTKFQKGIRKFIKEYSKQWDSENRPQGFEVQQYRLYGLLGRLACVKDKLIDFVLGKIKTIPELDEPPLYCHSAPDGYNGCTLYNGFIETVTYNTF